MAFTLHPTLNKDCLTLGDLTLCRVLLLNDQQFPWLILVPKLNDIKEAYQLSPEDQQQLQLESNSVGQLLMQYYKGHKLNVAALGNMVPQLHVHHIVRFEHDAVWPKPVWGNIEAKAYSEQALKDTCAELCELLNSSDMRFIANT